MGELLDMLDGLMKYLSMQGDTMGFNTAKIIRDRLDKDITYVDEVKDHLTMQLAAYRQAVELYRNTANNLILDARTPQRHQTANEHMERAERILKEAGL